MNFKSYDLRIPKPN